MKVDVIEKEDYISEGDGYLDRVDYNKLRDENFVDDSYELGVGR